MASSWPLVPSIVVFVVCAAAIALAGTRLVRVVDDLADRTGLGEAFFGMALLGGITSLSGSVLSLTAALSDQPQPAVSNAVGGIAVQMLFLVVADAVHRGINLEHAAPSLPNLMSAVTLILLLAFALVASFSPDATVLGVHPCRR
jgi:cation:H+ antiporter